MTDKQIIIDGHDVSKGNQKYMKESSPVENWYKAKINTVDGINLAECVHFTRQVDFGYCELSNDSCNEFQYSCVKNKNCYYKQLKRKEQECEELKKEREKKRDHYFMISYENARLEDEKFRLGYALNCKIEKLKQTLTEIKEIMKKHCRKCKKHKFYHFQLCCTCKYTDILQKISEVEDEV